MSEERVVPLDFGCHPEAAISGALLLQSERSAVLLFNAMSNARNADGYYEPVGTAVVELDGMEETRFGGPNDEARPEHPLYPKGLREVGYAICEVLDSEWALERADRNQSSARRIHGREYKERRFVQRHFLFAFHDSTLECLARDLRVTVAKEPFGAIAQGVLRRLAEE
jgi:hypothetical protein